MPGDGVTLSEAPGGRLMNWLVAVALVLSFAAGCHLDEEDSSAPLGDAPAATECDWRRAPEPGHADEPVCDVEFREVVRLEGDMDGVIPVHVVTALTGGRYLTATYSLGKLALWAPDGQLLEVIGNGPGEGPGEFDLPSGFAQVAEDEFLVLTGRSVIHKYSTAGRFLRSYRLPTGGGAMFAVTHGDLAITSAGTADGQRGFLLEGDSVRTLEIRGRSAFLHLAAAEDVGLWSAEYDRYVLRRHALPSGAVADSLVVARDWFPGPRDNEAILSWIHADGRGLLWAVVEAADPDTPPGSLPAWDVGAAEEQPIDDDPEVLAATRIRTRDTVVEAFTPDGRLVASTRFDSFWDAAIPLRGNLWYSMTEDMLTLIVLEAVLVRAG